MPDMSTAQPAVRAKGPAAEIVREFGPYPGEKGIAGVTFDGKRIWAATGAKLIAIDPKSGDAVDSFDTACDAGTAYDGKHFFQIHQKGIDKLDAVTGKVLATIPKPSDASSGLTWAEGSLWVGDYSGRKIHQIDPATGDVKRTIESNRFVTGVTWVDGQLWHGTWEEGESELRQLDPHTGAVVQNLVLPEGVNVSGMESDGQDLFYCGGGPTGKVRAVRRPKHA